MPAKTATEERDAYHMREALRLAHPMLGRTAPNPAVGCVIVGDGRIVGVGATAAGGRPHAETQALARAGSRARGATAVVTFEPCAHQGQTAPCARALIDAGVARVVIGCGDPYPQVRGRGIAMLKRAGIAVTVGVLEADCRRLNEGFITRVTPGPPFAVLKLAMTLDGRIAAAGGDSRWISSEESRDLVHRWRNESDIVMVGAGTVIADNPRLTCRIEGGRDPIRLVVDSQLRCDPRATIFRQRSTAPTMIATTPENLDIAKRRYSRRVEVIASSRGANGIDLGRLMREFAARGWSKVLIEGGAHLGGAALEAGVVDRVAFFIAPKILGGGLSAIAGMAARTMRSAITLDQLSARAVGPDWLIEATVVAHRRSRS
jgi:diaminohydroxyphosphoribosylaminopyrimidine deaminase/5-amino-6-(5-phosphoribosylamino)uracil reductase